jgi:hypothetical protein
MQLDTGCDADLVYDIPFRQLDLHLPRSGPNTVVLAGMIGGRRFEREPFFIYKNTRASWLNSTLSSIGHRISIWTGRQVLLGTIGAAFLENRVLLLDFAARRLAFLGKDEELPPSLAARIHFTPIQYRDHKIFVAATVNGIPTRDLAFDTGSGPSPVLTTRERWQRWIAGSQGGANNTVLKVWAWDRYINLVGAPIKGALCVGKACLDSPLAFFESSGAANCDFDRYPFSIAGVIGNALFDGRWTVVVDLPRRRFGLLRGSL